MLIKKIAPKNTEFIIAKKPCRVCGDMRRYASNGACPTCRHRRDAARTDDRRSNRSKCQDILEAQGMSLAGLSRLEKDRVIAMQFPAMNDYIQNVLGVALWA